MARSLSSDTRRILRVVGTVGCSIDELAVRTGIGKARLAKLLWHLAQAGWISAREEVRPLRLYRRVRPVPRPALAEALATNSPPHIEALQAAFGIRLPAKRARGRTVRRGE